MSFWGRELSWSNYTNAFPWSLHQTAIGDWSMVSCVLEYVSGSSVLKIHYEHPLQEVNGSYLFLYDLNIIDYISESHPSSTAHFTIRFETNLTDLYIYIALPNSAAGQWEPKNFTTAAEGSNKVVSVEMNSQYDVTLPGDLVVVFSNCG